jgi:hypothetical protein
MSKHKGCNCDSVGALDTGDIMTEGGVVVSAYGGFWAGEYLTEQVQMMKDNKLISGLAKVGAAIGVPMMFPSMVQNKMVAAAVIGFGVSGAKDTLEGITATTAKGLDERGWDNYDRNTEDTTYTEVKVEV